MTTDDERKLVAIAFFKILMEIGEKHLKTPALFIKVQVNAEPIERDKRSDASHMQDFNDEVGRFLRLGVPNDPVVQAAAVQHFYRKGLN
jgi:hypothetical protein